MCETLKTVSQSEIKQLLRQRLENPVRYVGKPLMIWRSYYFDGIQDSLVREVIRERNKSLPKEEWKGALVNPKRANKERLGLCIVDTMEDYFPTFNNFREIPMIVYGITADPDNSILDSFPNAEQYIFEPDFNLWVLDNSKRGSRNALLIDFLRKTTDDRGIAYRWYNYYNNANLHHRSGCNFPSVWLEGLSKLSMLRKFMRVKNLSDIPEEDFYRFLHIGISEDLIDEFRQYIIDNGL